MSFPSSLSLGHFQFVRTSPVCIWGWQWTRSSWAWDVFKFPVLAPLSSDSGHMNLNYWALLSLSQDLAEKGQFRPREPNWSRQNMGPSLDDLLSFQVERWFRSQNKKWFANSVEKMQTWVPPSCPWPLSQKVCFLTLTLPRRQENAHMDGALAISDSSRVTKPDPLSAS